jgi:hypothetical protein
MRLDNALTMEEVPVMVKIYELESIVARIDFDRTTREIITARLDRLKMDSARHSKIFSELISQVLATGGHGTD